MTGIYKITNKANGMCYIGQSVNIEKRWRKHKSAYGNPNAHEYDYYLYRAMRKYGIDNFDFEVIEECSSDLLNDKEKYWIEKYDSYRNGYNQTAGGESGGHSMKISTIIHPIAILVWLLIPLMFIGPYEEISIKRYLFNSCMPFMMLLVLVVLNQS